MNARNLTLPVLVTLAALTLSACGSGNSIFGAGASFPQPVYDQWSADLTASDGITVNYNPIGSGGGIAQLTAGTVDFGASDPPMDDAEMAAARKRGEPVHVPTVFGAITVAYRVKGVPSGLKLDGATVADIFQGRVTRWNDPAIRQQNPGVELPGERITVVHRSDESGTTKLFTSYLDDTSPSWHQALGAHKSVKWPVGIGAAKNAGVAASIKQTEGAIGYIEQAYALQNHFKTAALKNAAGRYVTPTLAATTAAGVGIDIPADLRFSAINSPNPRAYPISSATFILVYEDMCRAGVKAKAARLTQKFLDYGLSDGQAVAVKLGYAPLPKDLLVRARAKVAELQCNGRELATVNDR